LPKKIVLINQHTGYLFADVANAFAKEYDEVVLMAGKSTGLNAKSDSRVKIQQIIPYNRSSTIRRFLSWITCVAQISWLLLFKYRKYDLLVCSNPPTASTLLPIFFKRRITLLMYDIYPDGLIAGNFVTQKNIIYKCWAGLNRIAYKRVNKIITLTKGMATALSVYADKEKIMVVPAWGNIPAGALAIPESENLFLKANNLQGKFIVMYSGNMGKAYQLEPLVHVAEYFKDNKDIVFVIMGDGWKKEILQQMVKEKNLTNCLLLPYQPNDLFMHSLSAFHVGVVSLAQVLDKVAIPSKTYNLLAAKRPVFCIGSEGSGLAEFLNENNVGVAIDPLNIGAMQDYIGKLYNDKAYFDKLCINAGKTAAHYTSERAKEIVAVA
jgi:glycosyltransferase involved in cell wall biosynthesis